MLSQTEERDYWYWKEAELDFQSLQQSVRDILMQLPEAEGLRAFHSRDDKEIDHGKKETDYR
jgi:hypothetical protein